MENSKVSASVGVAFLHMAQRFCAGKNDYRPALHGVNVRRSAAGYDDGCVIEATNGHMAVVIHDAAPYSTN